MTQKTILLRLDEELFKALKHAAVDRLITVNGLLIEMIKLHIVKKEDFQTRLMK